MKHFTPDKMELYQFQCQTCGGFWYINKLEKYNCGDNIDFGCPQGCDDAGKHTRTIIVKTLSIQEVK